MQPKTIAQSAVLILLTTACVPTLVREPAADLCGAAGYQNLIGTNLAATALPDTLDVRIIRPNSMVTADHRPTRMNIRVDDAETIERVYCG